jgi:hypothetical protein
VDFSQGKFYTLVESLRECRRKKSCEHFIEYANFKQEAKASFFGWPSGGKLSLKINAIKRLIF